jgi:hypothetical protein
MVAGLGTLKRGARARDLIYWLGHFLRWCRSSCEVDEDRHGLFREGREINQIEGGEGRMEMSSTMLPGSVACGFGVLFVSRSLPCLDRLLVLALHVVKQRSLKGQVSSCPA